MSSPHCTCIAAALALLASVSASAQPLTFSRSDPASLDGARGIAIADFDRNGWPDVAQANGSHNSVSILLNDHGTLRRAGDVAVGAGPFAIAAADIDRDGKADLVVTNADAGSVTILKGRGDGTFAASTLGVRAGGSPRGVTLPDLNLDGYPDLVVSSYSTNDVFIWLGSAAGFNGAFRFTIQRPQGIAAGDFDHNGRPDVAVASESSDGLIVIFDAGGPTVPAMRVLGGAVSTNVVTVGDFNRDGWDDIAAASTNANKVALYLGGASGPAYARLLSTGGSPRGIDSRDVNLDGRTDLVVANRDSSDVSVFLGSSASTLFESPLRVPAGQGSRAAVVADLDADGLPDIVTANQMAAEVTVLTNVTAFARAGYVMGGYAYLAGRPPTFANIAPGDFNRDGKVDVLFADTNDNLVAALTDGPVVTVATVEGGSWYAAADLDLDGCLDAVVFVRTVSPGRVRTFLGDCRGAFRAGPSTSGVPNRAFLIEDVTRDAVPDLIASDGRQLAVFRGNANGSFTSAYADSAAQDLLAIGDVNNDGISDILSHSGTTGHVYFGRADGGRPTQTAQFEVPPDIAERGRLADVDHDGWLDLALSGQGIAIVMGSKSGFGGPIVIDTFEHTGALDVDLGALAAVSDIDVDGNPDLVTTRGAVWFGDGAGRFSAPQRFSLQAAADNYLDDAEDAHVVDFNRDGLPDILFSRGFIGVTVLLNARGEINHAPAVTAGPDRTFSYADQFNDDDVVAIVAEGRDPDGHTLNFEWRDEHDTVVSRFRWLYIGENKQPGTYRYSLRVDDGRGGVTTDDLSVTFTPVKEIVIHAAEFYNFGWESVSDPSAAQGIRLHDPDRGSPKVNAPAASPARYADVSFVAQAGYQYKLWLRLKADRNDYSNDSVWVQFGDAVDSSGRPIYGLGTTSGVAVNLEECSGCGLSGWGWEDDGWGAPGRNGSTFRFGHSGTQILRIQTREDGVSIDQMVLSAEKYLTARPGAAKNDTTVLAPTYHPEQ